jgi:uncharacterized protein YodC (DUF2158 family)
MTQKLNIGDYVRLNSGSPDLKVIGLSSKKVIVEWPRFGRKSERYTFPRNCVERVGRPS